MRLNLILPLTVGARGLLSICPAVLPILGFIHNQVPSPHEDCHDLLNHFNSHSLSQITTPSQAMFNAGEEARNLKPADPVINWVEVFPYIQLYFLIKIKSIIEEG
jgi:hypothetical protein